MSNRAVLIVDDAAPIRVLLSTALRSKGIRSELASDGEEATQLLRKHDFEVLVLDLMMPKMSGIDLVEAMRQGSVPRPAFVFVVTAASEDLVERLDPTVVQGVLRKPFDIGLFVEVVRALVTRDEVEEWDGTRASLGPKGSDRGM